MSDDKNMKLNDEQMEQASGGAGILGYFDDIVSVIGPVTENPFNEQDYYHDYYEEYTSEGKYVYATSGGYVVYDDTLKAGDRLYVDSSRGYFGLEICGIVGRSPLDEIG